MAEWIHQATESPTVGLIRDRIHLLSPEGYGLACKRVRVVNDQRQPHRGSITERLRTEIFMLHGFICDKEAVTANLELHHNASIWTLSTVDLGRAKRTFVELNRLFAPPDCQRERETRLDSAASKRRCHGLGRYQMRTTVRNGSLKVATRGLPSAQGNRTACRPLAKTRS